MHGCSRKSAPAPTSSDAGADATIEAGGDADAGESGTDSSAEAAVGDSGLPADQAWLADGAIWAAVAGLEFTAPCTVFEAKGAELKFPPLAWTGCGNGCEKTDAVQGYADDALFPVASTHVASGTASAFLSMEYQIAAGTSRRSVRRVVRLDSGETVAAMQGVQPLSSEFAHCVFGGGRESALAHAVSGGTDFSTQTGTKRVFTRAPTVPTGSWTWALPAKPVTDLPAGAVEFDTDKTGQVFDVGNESVSAMLDPSANVWTILESKSASQRGAGEGDLAVWNDNGIAGTSRVRGWAPDGLGVRTIIDVATYATCDVTISPTAIVGYVADGDPSCGTASKARLWRSPRAYTSAQAPLTVSPTLAGTPFRLVTPIGLKTWGDYAVLNVWARDANDLPVGAPYLLIVQLSTWKTWRLDARPGYQLQQDAFTLTGAHLYYGESVKSIDQTRLREVFRIELGNLASAPNVSAL